MSEQSTRGFANAPTTRSNFRSICIAFAMPLPLYGRSAIQRTCEEQRIFLGIPHLEQRKITISWRSPVHCWCSRKSQRCGLRCTRARRGEGIIERGAGVDSHLLPRLVPHRPEPQHLPRLSYSLLNHGTNDATNRLPAWVTAVRSLECAMEPSWHDHLVQGLNVCGRDTPGHKACQRAGSIGDEAVDQAGATSRL
jgi:hypothetical protein